MTLNLDGTLGMLENDSSQVASLDSKAFNHDASTSSLRTGQINNVGHTTSNTLRNRADRDQSHISPLELPKNLLESN
jgi:hypothetical protein